MASLCCSTAPSSVLADAPGTPTRPNYSGKHKAHGLLFLALTDERGNLVWISAAKPGRCSEITTARHNKITAHLREAGLGGARRPRLRWPGRQSRRPGDRHRPQSDPRLSPDCRPDGGEPAGQPRTSTASPI
ncbi:transposase family protein [Streptomyces sp. NBC_00376]|uniref:transposase family protein n=1 Tax=Streptomyces sp. NBC_00376 TaxID=2975730 RepID=UPI003FCE3DF2